MPTVIQPKSALLLLVLGILADNHDLALAANDLALFADRLHGRTNLHVLLPPVVNESTRASRNTARPDASDAIVLVTQCILDYTPEYPFRQEEIWRIQHSNSPATPLLRT